MEKVEARTFETGLFKEKALHRKQSGYVKKCMEAETGSWAEFCRRLCQYAKGML
ncbi:MAG: hypothetical protein J6D08_15415 [Lachnospiraceae bacterium]|nr:hypothetical protein [Lachnospiraceae bacterium]